MAFFEKDWYMRQLKMCIDMAASMLLGKEFTPYQVTDIEHALGADQLHLQIVSLLTDGEVNEAEDLLYDSVDPDNMEIYRVGLDFYDRLNQMTDKELTAVDFSREEIKDGLSDFCAEYGAEGLFDELKLSWNE